ncbi:MAG: VWA domain-containing protein, partial [Nitrospinae bacterium]|nr:VWA domain-containing protein [Nitrospinota bacterium]
MQIRGIEAQARPLPLVILADTSGSMGGDKISSLNQALAALVQDLQADDQTKESVLLSIITFDDRVQEVVTLDPVKMVALPILRASGQTCMGQAFRVALAQLGDPQRVPKRCLTPVIVLASDGQPTDEWRGPLQEIRAHTRVGAGLRLASAIGSDADINVLNQFVSTEYPVLKADEPEKIKT